MFTPAEIVAVLTAVAALVGLYLNSRKVTSDATTSAVSSLSEALKVCASLRDQLEASTDAEDDCQDRLRKARTEVAGLLQELHVSAQQIEQFQRGVPALRTVAKIGKRTASAIRVLDAARDGIVLSEKGGGRLIFVNKTFALALGYEPTEVIALGWRALVDPVQLEAMRDVEGEAWDEGGVTDNRYRHKAGHYVKMRWHFTDYDDGHALSIVRIERRMDA